MASRIASTAYNINDFPDEILCHIISFLRIEEAVRTSVLSRRWKNLFTLMTKLNFEVKSCLPEEELDRFLEFVDRFVLVQDRTSILRFRVSYQAYIDPLRVNRWVHALALEKIQELDLHFDYEESDIDPDSDFGRCPLPASLFSCESLVVLKLNLHFYYDIKLPATICLPHLKVIYIKGLWFSEYNSDGKLFSSCPVLEDLVFEECYLQFSKFAVSNQNLKRLTLRDVWDHCSNIVSIVINAPSLVHLDYTLGEGLSLLLLDVSSLTEAVIEIDHNGWPVHVSAAAGLLRGIKNIVSLEIHNYILKDLQRSNAQIPVFDKLTRLKLWNLTPHLIDSISLEYFLARCVVLESLVIEDTGRTYEDDIGIQHSLRTSPLVSLLDHLKTIEIRSLYIAEAEALMEIIEFFLKNARVLEKVRVGSIGLRIRPDERVKRRLRRKLLSFPRASEKCRVILWYI